MKAIKFEQHIVKCRVEYANRNGGFVDIIPCPHDHSHLVHVSKMDDHERICPMRDANVEKIVGKLAFGNILQSYVNL